MLLHSALVQVRAEAHQEKNKKIFWIADLLHNLPLRLLHETDDFNDLFEKIEKDVIHNGMERWFEQEISNINLVLDKKNSE